MVGCENVDVSQISDQDLERISDKLIVCNKPYMRFASGCCLDQDNNGICDKDERDLTEAEEKAEQIVSGEEKVTPPAEDIDKEYFKNSKEWQNVYSRALYRAIKGLTSIDFKDEQDNLYYAEKLSVNTYVITNTVDYYDAVSVVPYAALTKSYVLFADSTSIGGVLDFLDNQEVTKLILYGDIESEVKNKLDKFDPIIINKGGKFENNIEIVKEFKKVDDKKQVLLTNGEFIEAEIMSGSQPVIFIGQDNVPQITRDYIKNSNIALGVLVGNELVGSATFIRRQTGINVFVKFAQGARDTEGEVEAVDALNMYYLNKGGEDTILGDELRIMESKYIEDTNKFVITLKNYGSKPLFFKGTYVLSHNEGDQTVGDVNAIEVESKDKKTLRYTVQPIYFDEITLRAFITYGESKYSMEYVIDKDEYI